MVNKNETLNYFSRPETSNSDLTWLDKYWRPEAFVIDLEAAYRFGSLLDALITEPHLVNYFKYTVAGAQYTKDEFAKAEVMKRAFFSDAFCVSLQKMSHMQKVSVKHRFPISYNGINFFLNVRAKWDFFVEHTDLSGDLKSTACTTQKQFEESILHFNYDRQAAWYMDIENRSNFMFIGVSKVNNKIFKVPVKRDGNLYRSGREKYQELAFKYWYLFEDLNPAPVMIAEYDRELSATIIQ